MDRNSMSGKRPQTGTGGSKDAVKTVTVCKSREPLGIFTTKNGKKGQEK